MEPLTAQGAPAGGTADATTTDTSPRTMRTPPCLRCGRSVRWVCRSVTSFGGVPGDLAPFCFYRFGIVRLVDLNIKDLDDAVGQRLREQATAAGMSVQQYLRKELTRIAGRRSPAELATGREPMNRADFERIRQRLRDIDAA